MPPSPSSPDSADSSSHLRRLASIPAFLILVAAQLGAVGLVALSSFFALLGRDSASAWLTASAVTVTAGAGAFFFSRWLWRRLATSSFAVFVTWTLAILTVTTSQLFFAGLTELARLNEASESRFVSSVAAPSLALSSGAQLLAREPEEDCMAVLAERATLDAAKRAAAKFVGRTDAEDVAHRALLAVCNRHARTPIRELVPYFIRSAENFGRKAVERGWREGDCAWEELECEFDLDTLINSAQQLQAVEAAMCSLGERPRFVLKARLNGEPDVLTAQRLGTSVDNVRQIARRAVIEVGAIIRERERNCKH